MTTIRKEWIDRLKGFAIFLVVMGHVLTWQQYDNFYEIVNQPGSSRILGLWYVIYSFHMPLFMFCSGLVFYKKADYYSLANFFPSVKKSFSRLMIPYFIMGGGFSIYKRKICWVLVFICFISFFIGGKRA